MEYIIIMISYIVAFIAMLFVHKQIDKFIGIQHEKILGDDNKTHKQMYRHMVLSSIGGLVFKMIIQFGILVITNLICRGKPFNVMNSIIITIIAIIGGCMIYILCIIILAIIHFIKICPQKCEEAFNERYIHYLIDKFIDAINSADIQYNNDEYELISYWTEDVKCWTDNMSYPFRYYNVDNDKYSEEFKEIYKTFFSKIQSTNVIIFHVEDEL